MRRLIIIFFLLMITGICHGSECWNTIGAIFDITENWKFKFAERSRFDKEFYRYSFDLGLSRSVTDWFTVGVYFREIHNKDSKGAMRKENRSYLDLGLKGKLFDLPISNRFRFEYRDRELKKDNWRYRNEFKIMSPRKFTKFGLQPYLAEEPFIDLDLLDLTEHRLSVGVSSKLSENIKVNLFYLVQFKRSGGCWNDTKVIGTGLMFYF